VRAVDATPAARVLCFSFDSVAFTSVSAHGGREPILFCRAREGSDRTSFNFIDLSIVPAGAEIGLHSHGMDNEEIYIIVSGHGRMEAGGETFDVSPGAVIVNPPGGTHGLSNPGPGELRLVVVELKAEASLSAREISED
jgi:mannose-6-phosphate isomerase-like protein (cupin superfamily)